MTAIYRGMDRATLDAAYDNTNAAKDSTQYRERWWKVSEALRAAPPSKRDLRYGEQPRATLDFFPGGKENAPLFVFIHGGYWQRNEKERFSFTALGPLAHGINVAVPGYTLAPDATLTEIVEEIRAALTWLHQNAGRLGGFNRDKIFIGGWSAGGHLTAAVADHPAVRGGIPISGIFDLEPIALGVLNDPLQLSADEVARLSPQRNIPDRSPPLLLFVGGNELPELKRQSEDYAAACRARGLPVSLDVLPGHNHFSIVDEISKPDGALTRALRGLIVASG
jgi:arylformamidase